MEMLQAAEAYLKQKREQLPSKYRYVFKETYNYLSPLIKELQERNTKYGIPTNSYEIQSRITSR